MRITPFALTTLALSVRAQQAPKSSHEAEGAGGPAQPKQAQDALVRPPAGHARHHAMAERALVGYSTLGTRWNKCLDVTAGKLVDGTHPQIWDCASGINNNQQWKFSGNNLRTLQNKCLDIPGGALYAGSPVQIWECVANNPNQAFELVGANVRKKGTNFCLDVRDGQYFNGRSLQMYPCHWDSNPDTTNQHWYVGGKKENNAAPAPAPQPQAASGGGTWLGHPVISIDAFVQKHPECAPWKQAFIAAANDQGLHPTFLASVAEQESSCREKPENGFGIAQFMDANAARMFVHTDQGKSIENAWDAIYGMARYFRDLLNRNGNDLHAALRSYNGDVADGGLASYQADIYAWLAGQAP